LQGGTFRTRDLSNGKIGNITIPNLTCQDLEDKTDLVYSQDTYWKPTSSTFPSIDAVVNLATGLQWDVLAIQFTVTHDHGIIRHYLEEILNQLDIREDHNDTRKRVLPVFFAVPTDQFKGFPLQKYLTADWKVVQRGNRKVEVCVQQYALEVDISRANKLCDTS
jgi:hypothetical protein